MAIDSGSRLTVAELERLIQSADPAALLVTPRILRRVIKQDREITGLGLRVPHRKTYWIESEPLLALVERSELALPPDRELAGTVILIARPDADRLAEHSAEQALVRYWRLLFHARVHVAIEQRIAAGRLTAADVRRRVHELGALEFEEIKAVLRHDDYLLPPRGDVAAYAEFAAVYLELRQFSDTALKSWFPALVDLDKIDAIVAQDVEVEQLLATTRLEGAPERGPAYAWAPGEPPHEPPRPVEAAPSRTGIRPRESDQRSERQVRRLSARADHAAQRGNVVRSAIVRTRAARVAGERQAERLRHDARGDLDRLARRLQSAVGFTDVEAGQWRELLPELLDRAARGIRAAEARLLYDLQKVCVEHERGVYKLDLIASMLSLGRTPLRRPLPSQREVLTVKHLKSAERRLAAIRVPGAVREGLSLLLAGVVRRAESRLRRSFRPRVTAVFERVGLRPANLPERVALRKLVEELLDRVVERGYVTMGVLRDAISRNNLKLPDLVGVREFLMGDPLLRADRELAGSLDGVYRRGEVYLRWPQRISSLVFGTPMGRFITRFLALPFGGAYLIISGIQHTIVYAIAGHMPAFSGWPLVSSVMLLGLFLLGLIHSPAFRDGCKAALAKSLQAARVALVVWPRQFLDLPWVRRIRQSKTWKLLNRFVTKPVILTGLFWSIVNAPQISWQMSQTSLLLSFAVISLVVNSRIGRDIDELVTDWIVRSWDIFRLRILAAAFHVVVDAFQRVMEYVERVLYTVDEWLRFRRGDSRLSFFFKAVLGSIWTVVTYVTRFFITLLIEPQVNPIKHFPVVTVSHKILLGLVGSPGFQDLVASAGGGLLFAITPAVFLLPGVFGFLVWELKENWRLYGANRPRSLHPVVVGHHGETLVRLLKPAFHSGTVPKRFAKLRRAGRKENWTAARKHRAALDAAAEAVRRFVERELLAVLDECKGWDLDTPRVGRVELASNRVRIELRPRDDFGTPLWLQFGELSGWLTAQIVAPGWLDRLDRGQAETLTAAVAGLYRLGGIDLVHEQIESELAPGWVEFDIEESRLIVWRDREFTSAYSIGLATGDGESSQRPAPPSGIPIVALETSGKADSKGSGRIANVPDAARLVFGRRPISWTSWLEVWEIDALPGRRLPQAIARLPLLPTE